MLKVLTSLANELMFDVMANYNDLLTDDPFLKRWVTDYAIIFVNTYSQIYLIVCQCWMILLCSHLENLAAKITGNENR